MKTFSKFTLCLATLAALALTGCKSNKEAYDAAYERAKARQEALEAEKQPAQNETIEVVEKSSIKEAAESLEIIGKASEGTYGVVVGSFINRTNAESLLKRMQEAGYPNTVLGQNEKLMYRVIVSFFQNKADAQELVKTLKKDFPDAWILIKE